MRGVYNSEDEDGEYEHGTGGGGDGTSSHSKRRQVHSFYFTTGTVKRMESKEDGILTATCQVSGHAQCINIIPHHSDSHRRHSGCFTTLPQVSRRPEREDKDSKGPSWCRQEPPGLYDMAEPLRW